MVRSDCIVDAPRPATGQHITTELSDGELVQQASSRVLVPKPTAPYARSAELEDERAHKQSTRSRTETKKQAATSHLFGPIASHELTRTGLNRSPRHHRGRQIWPRAPVPTPPRQPAPATRWHDDDESRPDHGPPPPPTGRGWTYRTGRIARMLRKNQGIARVLGTLAAASAGAGLPSVPLHGVACRGQLVSTALHFHSNSPSGRRHLHTRRSLHGDSTPSR